MRVWLRPDRMAQLGITTTDVADAIRVQNNQYAAGKIGQDPALPDQPLVYTVTARGRLVDPEEFGNIILRASGPDGVLRVKDVARIELGAPDLRPVHHGGRQADHRRRDLPAVGRQRAQGRRCGAREHGRAVQNVSAGRQLPDSVRHHALGRSLDP